MTQDLPVVEPKSFRVVFLDLSPRFLLRKAFLDAGYYGRQK